MRSPANHRPTSSQFGDVAAVIVGGGTSSRMDGIDKVWSTPIDRPLLAYSLEAFDGIVDPIVVVGRPDTETDVRRLCQRMGIPALIAHGGARRQDSVGNGLQLIKHARFVAIHDAARPLITSDLIRKVISKAREGGAAVLGIPATDTIKVVENHVVKESLDRSSLWFIQTPQVFDVELLRQGLVDAMNIDLTDDAAAVERLGYTVAIVAGERENLKVTTRADLLFVEAILRKRQRERSDE